MNAKTSLKDALNILGAPEQIQHEFEKAYQIKGYPVKKLEEGMLCTRLNNIVTWSLAEMDKYKAAQEKRDNLIAESQKFLQLKESSEKDLKVADDLLHNLETITRADVFKARDLYFQAGYTDAIAFWYKHMPYELTKSAAEVTGKKEALKTVLKAIEELKNPDVINLEYFKVEANGDFKPRKITNYCPVCGKEIVFPKGHCADQAFKCPKCGNTFTLGVSTPDFPLHKTGGSS